MLDRDGGEYADLVNAGVAAMVRADNTADAVEAVIDLLMLYGWIDPEAATAVLTISLERERERIALAIEEAGREWAALRAGTVGPGSVRAAFDRSARLARSGGRDG